MRQHHWYHSDHPMLGKNQHPMSMGHQQLDILGTKFKELELISKIVYDLTFLDGFLFFSLLNLFDGGMYLSSSSLSANS